jgi:hypothetical protein
MRKSSKRIIIECLKKIQKQVQLIAVVLENEKNGSN